MWNNDHGRFPGPACSVRRDMAIRLIGGWIARALEAARPTTAPSVLLRTCAENIRLRTVT